MNAVYMRDANIASGRRGTYLHRLHALAMIKEDYESSEYDTGTEFCQEENDHSGPYFELVFADEEDAWG